MKTALRLILIAAFIVAIIASESHGANFTVPEDDGWYTWQVEAADGSELDAMVAELNDLQAAQLESRFETTKIERFQIFLAVAVLSLIFAEMIPAQMQVKTGQEETRKFFSFVSNH